MSIDTKISKNKQRTNRVTKAFAMPPSGASKTGTGIVCFRAENVKTHFQEIIPT